MLDIDEALGIIMSTNTAKNTFFVIKFVFAFWSNHIVYFARLEVIAVLKLFEKGVLEFTNIYVLNSLHVVYNGQLKITIKIIRYSQEMMCIVQ